MAITNSRGAKRSALTPPTNTVSNADIMELAAKVGVAVVRIAPAWRWWLKNPDGTKTNLGQKNPEAWDALQRMLPKVPVKAAKKLRLWVGDGEGVLRPGDARVQGEHSAARVYACAPSRAALVRMIHAYRGYERPGINYRVKAHWAEEWDEAMAGVAAQPGLWVQYAPGLKPERVA